MRRFTRLLAPLGLVLAVAAGCGDGSQTVSSTEGLSPRAILARAADATVAADSARMRFDMEMHGIPGEGDVTMHGEGAMDFAKRLATMTMEMPDMGSGVRGDAQVLIDDTVMYMRLPLPEEASDLLDGKSWIRMDLKEASKYAGVDGTQQMWNDPRQTLAMLEGVSGGVDVLGEEDIDGAHTTHYHADVDVRRAIENSGAIVDQEQFDQFISMMGDVVPMDVWIDDANQVRRMQMEMDFAGVSTEVTTELYDFGVDVDVAPPSSDDVVDMSDLMDRFGGELD
jgi:hypothetical protein